MVNHICEAGDVDDWWATGNVCFSPSHSDWGDEAGFQLHKYNLEAWDGISGAATMDC